jgi:hypothetical protein
MLLLVREKEAKKAKEELEISFVEIRSRKVDFFI